MNFCGSCILDQYRIYELLLPARLLSPYMRSSNVDGCARPTLYALAPMGDRVYVAYAYGIPNPELKEDLLGTTRRYVLQCDGQLTQDSTYT